MLPFIALFFSAAILSYFANHQIEQWQQIAIWIICGGLAIFLWLIPVIRHLSFYLDLSTSRIKIRQGIFGGQSIDLSLGDVVSASATKGGKLVVEIRGEEPLELRVPGRKKLAETINRLVSKRQ